MPATVSIGVSQDGTLDGGWFVDWMVRQDLRSRGIGIFLLRRAADTCHSLMTIQGSPDSRKALEQLKWSQNRRFAVYKINARAGAIGRQAGFARNLAAELARVTGQPSMPAVQAGGGIPMPARKFGRALASGASVEVPPVASGPASGGVATGPPLEAQPSG